MDEKGGALDWVASYNRWMGIKVFSCLTFSVAVILAVLSFLNIDIRHTACLIPLLTILAWLVFNALLLWLNAILLEKRLSGFLAQARSQGLPVDAMVGVPTLKELVRDEKRYTFWIFLMAVASLAMFVVGIAIMVVAAYMTMVGLYILFGFTMVGRRELFLSLEDIKRSYRPVTSPVVLEEPVYGFLEVILDPVSRLKLDEYKKFLEERIKPDLHVGDVMSKLILLLYLEEQGVIDRSTVRAELSEVIARPEYVEDMETHPEFGFDNLRDVIRRGRDAVPPFFRLLDRILVTLRDNLSVFKNCPTYADADVTSSIKHGDMCYIVVFLFNNDVTARTVEVIMKAPGFSPDQESVLIELPARDFDLPEEESLPLYDPEAYDTGDVIGLMSRVLDNLRVVWFSVMADTAGAKCVTVQARSPGEKTIFGTSMKIRVSYRLSDLFRSLGGIGGAIGGIAAAALRVLFWS